MLKLILPEEKYWPSFQDALEEFKKFPTPYDTMGIKIGLTFTNFSDYKLDCENNQLGIGLKEGRVKSTCLWMIEDEKFVGIFNLRHSLTENLKKEGGNVDYYIIPSSRGKGLAPKGLKLCCKYALEVLKLDEILVTCNALNIASYKTMKKVMCEYGGVEISPTLLEDKEKKRVWIKTKPRQEKIRPLAVAVIKKENKVLAIKGYDDIKNQTFYRLPGGGIEFCEKGEKTIKREFMEELGFEPINIKYSKTVENIFEFNGKKGHEIVLVYDAELPKNLDNIKKFTMQEEILKDKYAEFVEITGNLIYPSDIF
jgi:predicted acetyltransferase